MIESMSFQNLQLLKKLDNIRPSYTKLS